MKKAYADQKTITVNPEDGSVMIQQTSQPTSIEGVEVSSSGFRLNTGMGWGIDIAIVIAALAIVYIGKKYVDQWFARRK